MLSLMDFLNPSFPFTPANQAIIFALIIWSLIWKGLALWHSAHQGSKNWFIAILILNTAGILEILYLFVFARKKFDIKTVSKNLLNR